MKAYYKGKERTVIYKGKRINIYFSGDTTPNEFITSDNKKLKTSDNKRFIVRGA